MRLGVVSSGADSPPPESRPLLVGEANPYGADPYYALYPEPEGATGDRLRRLIMKIPAAQYLREYDRVNLCPRDWKMKAARERAEEILNRLGLGHWPCVVLLGVKVRTAFGFGALRSFVQMEHRGSRIVLLPHPSGLCREWNDPKNYERARTLLLNAGALRGGSE